MACLKSVLYVVLVLEVLVFVCGSVDILKKKIFAVESSLDLDIQLLRTEMSKLSDDLSHITNISQLSDELKHITSFLKNTPEGMRELGDVIKAPKKPKNDFASKYDLDQFKNRVKRYITMEKKHNRELMKELKTEISDFKAGQDKLSETLNELTRVQLGLTEYINETLIREIDILSNNIPMVTNECVSGLETLSQTNKNQSSAIDSSMKALSLKITGLEVKANNLDNKVSGLETLAQTKSSAIDSSMKALSLKITGLEVKENSIDNKVSGLETLAQTNKNQSSAIDSSIKALSLKITGLEVKANSIDNKVSGLETLSQTNKNQSPAIDFFMKALFLKINGLENNASIAGNKVECHIFESLPIINQTYTVGTTRLANVKQTRFTIGGRLEVLYNETWGTVCDDLFDERGLYVACRALGLTGISYQAWAYFGPGSEPTWMDNLECTGRESSLFDCRRHGDLMLGEEDCGHHEDVGVFCSK